MRCRRALIVAVASICLTNGAPALGQHTDRARRDSIQDSVLATALTAGEADYEPLRRSLLVRPEWDLGFMTLHAGAGLLFDVAAYSQDSASKEQFPNLNPAFKLRDARVLLGGRFKTKRPFTWQAGVMYDAVTHKWLVRQTGLMVAVPEIHSWFFLGRAKEGYSLNKVMVGYDGWSMERLPFTDATVPLLADGIKWLGYVPSTQLFWNLGAFMDAFSEGQSFSTYNYQFVARGGWVPLDDSTGTLLHLGMNFRIGDVNKDTLQLRSKPEAFPAPYFIDTGKFPAASALAFGPEVYYRPGRLLIGGEYYWQKVNSPETGNPWFHGGEAVVSWITTGEIRSYNPAGNYFREVSPDSTVLQGGPGAWAPLIKFSYSNLTNGPVQGGIFWRVTPMINWYLTDNLRLEFAYGYGVLTRFGLKGATQFFQSRIQMRL
ncbi:MAG TPA: porin [Gemmatimonadaceae bacterium]|nr:porin [Gemmatimonadaceae bacterium]